MSSFTQCSTLWCVDLDLASLSLVRAVLIDPPVMSFLSSTPAYAYGMDIPVGPTSYLPSRICLYIPIS